MTNTYTVYKHTSPSCKVYIGITSVEVKRRPRRKHTEAEKKAISETLKGRRSPMRGKHWSVEQRAKVGKAIVCKNTGKVYYSIREAARDTGADRANIGRVLKGIYKQTGGFIFEYTDQSI